MSPSNDDRKAKGRGMVKLILMGDGNVGKTSLRREFTGEGFQKNYSMTMGADFSIVRRDGEVLQIYDLAGQDNFRSVRTSYYKHSQGAILVFDVSKRETFRSLEAWMQEMLTRINHDIPLVVVGNKIDLRTDDGDHVSTEEALEWVHRLRSSYSAPIQYYETSVVEQINVDDVFNTLRQRVLGSAEDFSDDGLVGDNNSDSAQRIQTIQGLRSGQDDTGDQSTNGSFQVLDRQQNVRTQIDDTQSNGTFSTPQAASKNNAGKKSGAEGPADMKTKDSLKELPDGPPGMRDDYGHSTTRSRSDRLSKKSWRRVFDY